MSAADRSGGRESCQMRTIQRLQAWYAKHCNGDWEHQHGVTISTLDNPGWAIEVSLLGTSAERSSFSPIKTERSEHDWLHASIVGNSFKIACGPLNLDEALTLFCDWAHVPA